MSSEFRHQASFTMNVVLAVTAVVLFLHQPEPVPAVPVKMTNPAPVVAQVVSVHPQYPDSASASDQRRWLIDQLRAMGVPNNVLARVALEDLEKRQNEHSAEVSKKCYGDPDTLAALQLQFDKGLDAQMRAALGDAGFKQWDLANMLREADSGKVQLTDAETDAAYGLWKKLQEQQLDLEQAKVDGTMDPADISDAIEKTASAFNQQMKDLLGADRYAQSQEIDDGTAGLQQELAGINTSGSQFQQMLQTFQQWNDQRAALDKQYQNDPSSSGYATQLKALDDARDQTYQQVLGVDAFSTLQKQQDPGYNEMKQNENLWGLSDYKIDSVYAVLQFYNKTVQDYQAQVSTQQTQGQTMDWNTVNNTLQQFAGQTQQTLQNYLGQNSYNQLQQNGVFSLSPPVLPVAHAKP